ncbi:hypothetical protein RSal33209_2930 [Renibacterium salmoninarum ATCC 33209]|uniref:Uncharacterized protein n=1 Tax=Renibacterium salmoninarum (strain ATCC 33209 / DSM 20767 / JCM 11484 / NBRC 15589 / NCIMB 2235) TaxID=288705 RepID=A9WTY2_RENSM|nr:hypothetical protein RSal33209_2930 [Renibacterium salmoninarum ATCC 33209]
MQNAEHCVCPLALDRPSLPGDLASLNLLAQIRVGVERILCKQPHKDVPPASPLGGTN